LKQEAGEDRCGKTKGKAETEAEKRQFVRYKDKHMTGRSRIKKDSRAEIQTDVYTYKRKD
jgi:hypothetical protein